MSGREHSNPSLTRRLVWVLISALGAIAVVLGADGTLLIRHVVQQSFDDMLGASLQEIAATLAPDHGVVNLSIPPSALGMLEDEQRDNVYYSVHEGSRLLTGYSRLPLVSLRGILPGELVFRTAEFKGQEVRIAAEARHLPGISSTVVVEVARVTGERRKRALVMLLALYLLESILVVFAGLLVWPTVRWSLQPVNRLRDELNARPTGHANFAPLDLREAPAELIGLVDGFNHLLERLEGAVAGIRQFTADASHQMRTPLAVLKTHLAVLDQYVVPGSRGSGSLADLHEAVTRLEALLTRLIVLARADEAVRSGIRRSPFDVREVIAKVVGELYQDATRSNISLSVDGGERPAWAYGDLVICAEILENLVDNAIRYNRPGGTVCIAIEASAELVTVSIEDDGPGVPASERKHIFERFYRLQRDQGKAGSGLGLSIVKTLSEALNARVSLGPAAAGHGLKVSVQFEAARAEHCAAAVASGLNARRTY